LVSAKEVNGQNSAANVLYFQVMNSRQIPAEWLPQYTYQDYERWEGDWELIFGIPYAMSPSPKRVHQSAGRRFIRLAEDALMKMVESCDCEVFYKLDWIIDDTTVVRPDVIIVCGKFNDDFLLFPPSLILEITSKSTQMADRNIKRKLYESQKVPYYLIADPEKQTVDIYELKEDGYYSIEQTVFKLGQNCHLQIDVLNLWQ
jgi:Uma2 family endonuclease